MARSDVAIYESIIRAQGATAEEIRKAICEEEERIRRRQCGDMLHAIPVNSFLSRLKLILHRGRSAAMIFADELKRKRAK